MCGFVAVLSPTSSVPQRVLEDMRDRIAHRGPDAADIWQKDYPLKGSVSFGFRRLSIVDTRDVSDQPMISEDGRKVIVFNGEIYNFLELRERLQGLGYSFRTRGDAEVLLRSYEHWGADALKLVNGMFSFIIWDEEKSEALIARDRFGEKPLYFAALPQGGYAFSSEMKGLFAHPDVKCSLDWDTFSDVHGGELIFSKEKTIFDGIKQFSSASMMRLSLDKGVLEYKRYWTPSYSSSLQGFSRKQIVASFEEKLHEALKRHTETDVPIVCSLSGGLDSSSILGISSQKELALKTRPTEAISVEFPEDPTISETPYIRSVLERTGVTGISITPSVDDLVKDLRSMHWHQETIIPGISMYLEWCVMKQARASGYKALLDGQGADEVLAGYRIYFQMMQSDFFKSHGMKKALKFGAKKDSRLEVEARKYVDYKRRFLDYDSLSEEELNSDYGDRHSDNMMDIYGDEILGDYKDMGSLRRELAANVLYTSLPSNLFSGDRNSMAHGVECRYPYLDYEFFDFCNHLPDWAYIDDGWQKLILRETIDNVLPSEVVWRVDKVGFAAPQDKWLNDPHLSRWIEERIFDKDLDSIAAYDRSEVEKYWKIHQAGEADYSTILWQWASSAELIDMWRNKVWSEGVMQGESRAE